VCLDVFRNGSASGPDGESCTRWNAGIPVRPLSVSTAAGLAFARNIFYFRFSVVEADPAGRPNFRICSNRQTPRWAAGLSPCPEFSCFTAFITKPWQIFDSCINLW